MAAKRPDDAYGSFGGVPDQVAESGTGGRSMDAHANPEDFGSQVGGAVQQLGGEGEQIAHRFGDLMSETAGNNAEVGFIQDAGNLKAKYAQFEGNQAEMMRPQYE